jgi:hypothetical protein
MQAWGTPSTRSENHLFEENWIQDLASQFCQLNAGDGVPTNGILYDNVKKVTFRRNVIIGVSANANVGIPGVRFENNTFYRMAYELNGISYGGSLTRGDSSGGILRNNIFLAGGVRASVPNDNIGYYSLAGFVFSKEVIAVFVTKETNSSGNIFQGPITVGIFDNLRANAYIDGNGKILAKARALSDITQLALDGAYAVYKQALYDYLVKTVRLDADSRDSFVADYNFVAGAESAGFPAKRHSECDPNASYTDWNFCEPHGINGGNPQLANLAHLLGPDGVPFTLDDGLKQTAGSPLCGKGEGGTDIGAYSCDPRKVFSNNVPKSPSNLTIIK